MELTGLGNEHIRCIEIFFHWNSYALFLRATNTLDVLKLAVKVSVDCLMSWATNTLDVLK